MAPFTVGFKILCAIATVGTTSWCFYNYLLNDDVASISFETFQQKEENIYPSISLCLINPFIEESLRAVNLDFSSTAYRSFLQGLSWNQKMLQIDYDAVSKDINDYILGYDVLLYNGSRLRIDFKEDHTKTVPPAWDAPYIGLTDFFRKCATINIPHHQSQLMINIFINMKLSLFPNGVRPDHYDFTNIKSFRNRF